MLTRRSLPLRGLAYHWRGNLAVALGAAVGAAVLAGALFVGDSLRGSLRDRAERQRNGVTAAWAGSRMVRAEVADKLPGPVLPAMLLNGSLTADRQRLPKVTVLGLTADGLTRFGIPVPDGWDRSSAVILGHRAANQLQPADGKVRLSVEQYSAVPRASLLGRRAADDTTAGLSLTVATVLTADHPANDFSLSPNPAPPANVFVPLWLIQKRQNQPGRVNALLGFGPTADALNAALPAALDLDDLGLRVKLPPARKAYLSVESEQLLLDPPAADAAETTAKELGLRAERTLVYLANAIESGGKSIPYSVVAALDPAAPPPLGPFLPPGVSTLTDDKIVLADWPESPLKDVPVGSQVTLKFFKPEVETGAEETSATFTLAGRVPLAGPAADPDLTPPFPGITDKLSIGDWNPPFPFDRGRIKPGDANERFWNRHKATPKAYLSRAAGERLFGSRFGAVTSVRVAGPDQLDRFHEAFRRHLSPARLGVQFDDTIGRLQTASKGGTDFGGLFLGFSLFLIVSALMLVGLLFRLNAERRAKEVGGLLAAGYPPTTVRNLLLAEGLVATLVGAAVGVAVAVGYSRLLVAFLTELWPDPTVKTFLRPHAAPLSAGLGFGLTVLMSLAAVWLAVRGLMKVPPPLLLRGETQVAVPDVKHSRWTVWVAAACGAAALALLAVGPKLDNPDFRAGSFFGGGGLLFAAGLLLVRRWLRGGSLPRTSGPAALLRLGPKNAGRFPGRSLLTVLLLGTATYLLVAVESFRRGPDGDFADRHGGSGGFNLIAEADVPLFQPLDRKDGRDDVLEGVRRYYQDFPSQTDIEANVTAANSILDRVRTATPFRVRAGDDASCLNLYQAGRPRIVGVPDSLIERGGFKFYTTEARTPDEKANPWRLLTAARADGAMPVFAEQNTALYMLKVPLGGELTVPDEAGRPVRLRIVGTFADSPFQSELLMADAPFRRLYPREEGFRLILLDTPPENEEALRDVLQTGLRANGLLVTPTRERVAAYQAVIGTYLSTFQLLGGLGLFLGVLGLGVVILRGIWERTSELALLRAFGYTSGDVRQLVLAENLFLLTLGVGLGLVAALVSVAPHAALGGRLPWAGLAALLLGVAVVGGAVVFAATARAARVPILTALRKD